MRTVAIELACFCSGDKGLPKICLTSNHAHSCRFLSRVSWIVKAQINGCGVPGEDREMHAILGERGSWL